MADDSILQKRCSKCGEIFPATTEYFWKFKLSKDGLRVWCIQCSKDYMKDYHTKHRDKALADMKRRRETPEYKVRKRELANKPEARKMARDYMAECRKDPEYREKQREYMKQWSKDNVLLKNAHSHKRRAKKTGNGGTHTKADVLLQYKTQKGLCWWCGKKLNGKYQIDHRIAISKGGTDWPNNLCLSCEHCNLSKGAKMPWEFAGRLL